MTLTYAESPMHFDALKPRKGSAEYEGDGDDVQHVAWRYDGQAVWIDQRRAVMGEAETLFAWVFGLALGAVFTAI